MDTGRSIYVVVVISEHMSEMYISINVCIGKRWSIAVDEHTLVPRVLMWLQEVRSVEYIV